MFDPVLSDVKIYFLRQTLNHCIYMFEIKGKEFLVNGNDMTVNIFFINGNLFIFVLNVFFDYNLDHDFYSLCTPPYDVYLHKKHHIFSKDVNFHLLDFLRLCCICCWRFLQKCWVVFSKWQLPIQFSTSSIQWDLLISPYSCLDKWSDTCLWWTRSQPREQVLLVLQYHK